MEKVTDTYEFNDKILESILPLLMRQGLKATTMDSIASSLKMSKRTLYEIFGSKEEMFKEVHRYYHNRVAQSLKAIFQGSDNVMEAIIKCFLYNRDTMGNASADFIRDMEQFANQDGLITESHRRHHYQNLLDVLEQGVKEGYFRDDMNLTIQCRMFTIQMEALKRTEELFPKDITLLDVYDSIIIGFLRGISSQKGLEELEHYLPFLTSQNNYQTNLK